MPILMKMAFAGIGYVIVKHALLLWRNELDNRYTINLHIQHDLQGMARDGSSQPVRQYVEMDSGKQETVCCREDEMDAVLKLNLYKMRKEGRCMTDILSEEDEYMIDDMYYCQRRKYFPRPLKFLARL